MIIPTECYPLRWPEGVPRSTSRHASSFVHAEPGPQIDELYRQLNLIRGIRTIVVSSNMPLRSDGTPSSKSSQQPGGDPGVVAYWTRETWRAGRQQLVPYAMPCDRWHRIACNLRALALTIDAMRGQERWGAITLEQAFRAFAALPPGSGEQVGHAPRRRPWRDVLGGAWPAELDAEMTLALAKAKHRKAIADAHPDHGGDAVRAAELNDALADAEKELS